MYFLNTFQHFRERTLESSLEKLIRDDKSKLWKIVKRSINICSNTRFQIVQHLLFMLGFFLIFILNMLYLYMHGEKSGRTHICKENIYLTFQSTRRSSKSGRGNWNKPLEKNMKSTSGACFLLTMVLDLCSLLWTIWPRSKRKASVVLLQI